MSVSAPAATPIADSSEDRRVSDSVESLEKFNSRAELCSSAAEVAISTGSSFGQLPVSNSQHLFTVDLDAFFPKPGESEESFNNSLVDSVVRTSRRLTEDKIVLRRSPTCRKAAAVGGVFKHSLFGILKTPFVPVALIGTIIHKAKKKRNGRLKIEALQSKINNDTETLQGQERKIKQAINEALRGEINSREANTHTEANTHIIFIKMIKLCEAFNAEFTKNYNGRKPQERARDKMRYLTNELTRLIQREKVKLGTNQNKTIDLTQENNLLARSLLAWIQSNKTHNESYEEREKAAASRKIPARIEHSLTLYGIASSFLKVGTYFRNLKSGRIETPERLSLLARNLQEFSYFNSIDTIFKERLKQFKDSKVASLDLSDGKITNFRDNELEVATRQINRQRREAARDNA